MPREAPPLLWCFQHTQQQAEPLIRAADDRLARDAGVLLGRSEAADPIDATVVLVAESGDRMLTSDPGDLRRLAAAAGARVAVVPADDP